MRRRKRKKPEASNIKKISVESVVLMSKTLEELLTIHYGAQGHSLREKTINVQDKLPYPIQHTLLKINHIRNQVIHNVNFNIKTIKYEFAIDQSNPKDNEFDLIACFEEVLHYLNHEELLTRAANK